MLEYGSQSFETTIEPNLVAQDAVVKITKRFFKVTKYYFSL